MAKEEKKKDVVVQEEPSAETKITEEPREEHMIPKTRLDQALAKSKDLEERLAKMEKQQNADAEDRLKQQEEWKELAEKRGKEIADLQPQAAKLTSYTETLEKVLAAEVEQIPEAMRGLIPEQLSVEQKLDWLSQNKSLLSKPQGFDIGANKRSTEKDAKKVDLTAEEKQIASDYGMTAEEYVKYKGD